MNEPHHTTVTAKTVCAFKIALNFPNI